MHEKTLLEGFDVQEAPALEAWLELERDRLQSAWRLSALRHAEHLSAHGQHREAMAVLERLLDRDPLQEDVVNTFMRESAALGLRHDAIRAFERLRDALEAELNLEPMPQTLALLEQIRRSATVAAVAPVANTRALPRALLRPLRLHGREREVVAFERSNAIITVFLAEAGAGKTRLLEDIAPRAAGLAANLSRRLG
ncbi:MAG: hypothetical protein HC933_20605 [Pleurocapsa sp. SU_196_0]|nr:hypothetical protein [Pleurocapsa sp. SU_196_0]